MTLLVLGFYRNYLFWLTMTKKFFSSSQKQTKNCGILFLVLFLPFHSHSLSQLDWICLFSTAKVRKVFG